MPIYTRKNNGWRLIFVVICHFFELKPMEQRHFKTEELNLSIAGIAIRLLQVTNVDELFDQLIAKGEAHEDVQDERIPYWAELWPAAIALGEHLPQSNLIQPGTRVTEIGCGLGLAGIIAGKLGAKVTLTDYLPEAMAFAKRNWALNFTPENQADFELMDWREPNPALAADLVLASDVCYEKRFLADLPHAFRTLCKPGGRILVSDPYRSAAKGFFESLEQQGFLCEKFKYEIQTINGGNPMNVQVFELQIHDAKQSIKNRKS